MIDKAEWLAEVWMDQGLKRKPVNEFAHIRHLLDQECIRRASGESEFELTVGPNTSEPWARVHDYIGRQTLMSFLVWFDRAGAPTPVP